MILRVLSAGMLTAGSFGFAVPAVAQDFAAPGYAGPSVSPLLLIERGLPGVETGARAEGTVTRWYGLPDLTTRAAALGLGWGVVRAAAAISQSGDPELGWNALGVACGAAKREGGGALRAAVRRDRSIDPAASVLGSGVGVEVGAGAWVEVGLGFKVWADSPQLWTRGTAPPLRRPLEIGGMLEAEGLLVWWSRRAPGQSGTSERWVGVGFRGGSWSSWLEARDRPLRGGAGFSARVGHISAGLGLESHPVLGETVRLSVGATSRTGPPRPPAEARAGDTR